MIASSRANAETNMILNESNKFSPKSASVAHTNLSEICWRDIIPNMPLTVFRLDAMNGRDSTICFKPSEYYCVHFLVMSGLLSPPDADLRIG